MTNDKELIIIKESQYGVEISFSKEIISEKLILSILGQFYNLFKSNTSVKDVIYSINELIDKQVNEMNNKKRIYGNDIIHLDSIEKLSSLVLSKKVEDNYPTQIDMLQYFERSLESIANNNNLIVDKISDMIKMVRFKINNSAIYS